MYLASEVFRVTAVDLSAQGLTQARQLAASRNVSIETQQVDLEAEGVDLGESRYDLVAVCFFLHRPLFPALRRAVRPGGLVALELAPRQAGWAVEALRKAGFVDLSTHRDLGGRPRVVSGHRRMD